jgi:hypothetical protein
LNTSSNLWARATKKLSDIFLAAGTTSEATRAGYKVRVFLPAKVEKGAPKFICSFSLDVWALAAISLVQSAQIFKEHQSTLNDRNLLKQYARTYVYVICAHKANTTQVFQARSRAKQAYQGNWFGNVQH